MDTVRRIARALRGAGANAWEARARGAPPLLGQLIDHLRFRFGRGRVGLSEFFDFHLYDRQAYTDAERAAFVGSRRRVAQQALVNDGHWLGIATDKVIFNLCLRSLGLPCAMLQCVFVPYPRFVGTTPSFSDADALFSHLREKLSYPCFVKPIDGFHGRGALGLAGYEVSTDEFALINGEHVTRSDFIDTHLRSERHGFMFEKLVVNHPDLVALCGDRLSTVRIWTMARSSGPRLYRAVWKVTVGRNMTDNTRHQTSGNLWAAVDVKSGRLGKVFRHAGFHEQTTDIHPDTGASLSGRVLPLWSDVERLLKVATLAFPGLPFQAWDIAITPDGPLIVELSLPGDIDALQAGLRQGHWDEEFDKLVEDVRTRRARPKESPLPV